MWNYVSFFLHLKEKEATEYNSHEQVSEGTGKWKL